MSLPHNQNIDARYGVHNNVGGDQYNVQWNVKPNSDLLRDLDPAKMDPSRRTGCLKGTRADVLKIITDWVSHPTPSQNVLWLHGLAGSGKSTITTTLANHYRESGQLGAFLFFDRDVTERSDPALVLRTMVHQLGQSNRQIGEKVSAAIECTPTILVSPTYFQFKRLLIGPLSSMTFPPSARIVLILDALDECGSPEEREALVEVIARNFGHPSLAPNFRFVVTSRQEIDIRNAFQSRQHIRALELTLTSAIVHRDIESYFRHHMALIRAKHSQLGSDWPGEGGIVSLTERASGLFVWASTASKFIDGHDPRKRLESILQGNRSKVAETALDTLYRTALRTVEMWEDKDFVSDFRAILGMILVLRDRLSSAAFDILLANPEGRPSLDTIARLGCVVSASPTIRVIHPSFADFLLTRSRCERDMWFFQKAKDNRTLAIHCLQRLDNYLRRNVCDMSLSHDLGIEFLSEDVTYACLFWIDHVCAIKDGFTTIMMRLELFLNRHLLHWFEAMSILRRSRDTIALLKSLLAWITYNAPYQKTLHEVVHDACRLAQTYASSIEDHPLLVYFTAMPFIPVTSSVYRKFHDIHSLPTIPGGFHLAWSPLLLVLAGHGDGGVNSVVFSPDGTQIVSGSGDKTIRVWDANSGAEALPAMRGHESSVLSVCFSFDGTRIVSGSWDATIRVWDAKSGAEIISPLQKHSESVLSVTFSPDDTLIASGSGDKTVRVYDAISGKDVLPIMEGHEGAVLSVRFSPDGTRIISVSDDKTIRVWDANTGTCALPPLRGHEEPVLCFAVSHDSARIASGSGDHTVRVWDLITGDEAFPPLYGHESSVWAVGFSPDGTRIVSGSGDKTIRVWDAFYGSEILPPQRGHEDAVLSVKFSPDGTQIVSGSRDNTVRVWDTNSRTEASLIRQHEDIVYSVAFSPNGTRVASGSEDTTIRVWDTKTGAEALPPIRGHENTVNAVTYSSDGTRIVSRSLDENIRAWDASSGLPLTVTRDDRALITSPRVSFSTIMIQDRWIVDTHTNRTISKIPAIVELVCYAAHEKSLAVGTRGGRVFVMHFPAHAFSSPETRFEEQESQAVNS